jgi:DNA-binding CsgD family transcriptional regulator
MPRVFVVAESEQLQAALVAALASVASFEVVGTSSTDADVPADVDVVISAHPPDLHPISREGEEMRRQPNGTTLTKRERDILELVADGHGNKQIAARLGISTNTVKTHLEMVFEKLGVSSRAEAVAAGVRRGLLLL